MFGSDALRYDISKLDKSRDELVEIVNQWVVGTNAERDRKVIIRSIIDGICYEPLAEEMDLSVSTVKRIVKKRAHKVLIHM